MNWAVWWRTCCVNRGIIRASARRAALRIRRHPYRAKAITAVRCIAKLERLWSFPLATDTQHTLAGLRTEPTNFNQVLITGYHVDGKLGLPPAGIVIAPDHILLLRVALRTFVDCHHRVEAAAA